MRTSHREQMQRVAEEICRTPPSNPSDKLAEGEVEHFTKK